MNCFGLKDAWSVRNISSVKYEIWAGFRERFFSLPENLIQKCRNPTRAPYMQCIHSIYPRKSNLCGVIKMHTTASNIKMKQWTNSVSHYIWAVGFFSDRFLHTINFVLMFCCSSLAKGNMRRYFFFYLPYTHISPLRIHHCYRKNGRFPLKSSGKRKKWTRREIYSDAHTSSRNGRIKTATAFDTKKKYRGNEKNEKNSQMENQLHFIRV